MRIEKETPRSNAIIAIVLFIIGSVLGLLGVFGVLDFKDIFVSLEEVKAGTMKIEEVLVKIKEIGDPFQALVYVVGSLISMLGGFSNFLAVKK